MATEPKIHRSWETVAEELSHEVNPEKVTELATELDEALTAREELTKGKSPSSEGTKKLSRSA